MSSSPIANMPSAVAATLFGMPRRANKLSSDPEKRRLAVTRIALGFERQDEFAETINVRPNTYNPWEKDGPRRIPLDKAERIQRKHHIPIEWIYEGVAKRLPMDVYAKLVEMGELPPLTIGPKRPAG